MSSSLSDAVLLRAANLASATLHEAAHRIGALPGAIGPVRYGLKVVGRAFPVLGPSGDNLWLHRAIYEAQPGDVLVANVGTDRDFGYWGEVMAVAAQSRGLAGLVIDGGVRDGAPLMEMGFPVFSHGISIRGTGKDPEGHGTLGQPVVMGSTTVRRGDLVVGDDDGVVVIPAEKAEFIVAAAEAREEKEVDILERLRSGQRSLDIYDLPRGNR